MEYVTDFAWTIKDFVPVPSPDEPKILISEDFSINGTTASAYLVFCHSTMPSRTGCSLFICTKVTDKNGTGNTSVHFWITKTEGKRIANRPAQIRENSLDRIECRGYDFFVSKHALIPSSPFMQGDIFIVRCHLRFKPDNAKKNYAVPLSFSSDKILEGSLVICGKKPFYVAKHFLISRSNYFKTLLESGNREEKAGIIRLEQMDFDTLSQFKHSIYFGHFSDGWSFESIQHLHTLAGKYQFDQFKAECKRQILNTMGETELVVWLKIGFVADDTELKEHSFSALRMRFYLKTEFVYFYSDQWINFAAKNLKLALEIKVAAYKAVGILPENYSL